MWVGLTFAHAVLGYLWPILNPWTAFARLVRRTLGMAGGDDKGVLPWPEALGAWPAVALLLLFAWFELVHPAPQDPAILAFAVAGYSILTVAGMVLFGNGAWERNVEIFSRFFRIVSWIAPMRTIEAGGTRRLALTFPGARLLRVDSLPAAGVVFVVVALATVSFDGLSRTFWWLDLVGENPLEHPGRTALVGRNTFGLAGAAAALLGAYALTAAAGAWWSGSSAAAALRRFVVSIVPIAFGYHFAHYLPSFLVDAQYASEGALRPPGPRLEPSRHTRSARHRLFPHPPRLGGADLVRPDRRHRGRPRGRGRGPARPRRGGPGGADGHGTRRTSPHGADDRLHPVRSVAALDTRSRPELARTRAAPSEMPGRSVNCYSIT